jgi:hypothetical protein
MHKLFFLISFFFSFEAHSWTLASTARTGFPVSEITIKISSNNCTNAGFTAATLESLVNDAINDYWSKVPTSSLKLTTGGILPVNLSADDLTAAANKTDANTIIVGCGANATTFSSGSTLAVGGLGCAASGCRGAVLLNDTAATQLNSLSRTAVLATFAHELGHALGLGHSSVVPALMYYSVSNKTQKSLAQDDIDGISYLYPSEKEVLGLGGACGTIDTDGPNKSKDSGDKNGPFGSMNFLGSILVGLALVMMTKFLKIRNIS